MATTHSAPNPTAAPGRRHAVFHPLRVASVDRLTEDSVAITFDDDIAGHASVAAPLIYFRRKGWLR